ncbi:tetratricopeptide repeat-containing sensor histidine kinase [Flavobacterium sedimenticola]|uniref:Histidine kinase n=1 Tax=Flavobacterium sedimenticola TaxID=3043286 RepID=A0ABT6XNT4_9FLAO|nr:tetratricopeptide repeat protein [Flavobacterium sedimenticola]MDI9256752.1 histidine kinase [Flavobacterium sedimenticola]
MKQPLRYAFLFLLIPFLFWGQIRKGDAFRNTIDSLNRVAFDAPGPVAKMADSMLVIARKKKRPIDVGLLLLVRGITETCRGNNDQALKFHMKAYHLFDSLKSNEGKIISLGNLATVELNMENYTKALQYLNTSLKLTNPADYNNLKDIYVNLGVANDHSGNYKAAIEYYKKAIPHLIKSGNYNSLAINYHNMSSAYSELKDLKRAEYYSLKALDYQKKSGSKRTLAIVTLALSDIYTDLNRLNESKKYLDICGKTARDLKTPYYIQAYYIEYYEWLKKRGDFELATVYSDSLMVITNTINSEDKLQATAELEAKFENDLKSKEIELLKVQKKLQDTEMKRNEAWRYILALITVLCLVLIFILYRNYKLKQKANQLLSQEKDALAQQNLQLENENILVQFETLKNQVSPHFLFNSLNALASLITTDQQKALAFTNLFSKIFRNTLELKDRHLITLSEELQHVNAYLQLQKMRFHDNLIIDIQIDSKVMAYFLPPFSLQMVIENAVKHNVISSEAPLFISISNTEDFLRITNNLQQRNYVEDSTKTGLKNIISRYKYITALRPVFEIRNDQFVVELPIIKEERE